jgi:hypothetical protein
MAELGAVLSLAGLLAWFGVVGFCSLYCSTLYVGGVFSVVSMIVGFI